jgi:hypothetical protein
VRAEVQVAPLLEDARVRQANRLQDALEPLAGGAGVPARRADLDAPILRRAADAVTVEPDVHAIRPRVAHRQPLPLPPRPRDTLSDHPHFVYLPGRQSTVKRYSHGSPPVANKIKRLSVGARHDPFLCFFERGGGGGRLGRDAKWG